MAGERSKLMPSDIDTYAQYVEGIDPARYYDSQAQEQLANATKRWPLLAEVLNASVGGDRKR